MFTAKIENQSGQVYTLTGKEAEYQLINIDGLNPPPAIINTATIAGMDGALFNSSRLETRNIVLTVIINGDVEANRLRLYSYFRTKSWCKFYFANDTLDVTIEGYVQTVECNMFTNKVTAQISIICPFPYFKGGEQIADSSGVESLFVFPFSINADAPVPISNHIMDDGIIVYNSTESVTGAEITVEFEAAATSVEIKNVATGDDFKLVHAFEAGDTVVVNTTRGQKSIKLIRDGAISNLFSALVPGSVFPQIYPGSNVFSYLLSGEAPAEGAAFITFRYYNLYRGV